jgi:PAS domain S-box-containing protein
LVGDSENQTVNFEALFEYATEGILVTDEQGIIVQANRAVGRLFGYDQQELLGKPVEVLVPPHLAARHAAHRHQFETSPHHRQMGIGLDLYARRKDNSEFPVEISLSPFVTERGKFVIAFIVDITLRKQHEEAILLQQRELEELTAALKISNENLERKVVERTHELETAKNALDLALTVERHMNEMKSRFVSMASHEFRTPLTAVVSSASLIETYTDRGDAMNVKKHAHRIKSAVDNLNTILGEFLSLGKLEEGKVQANLKEVNVQEVVNEVGIEMKHIFKKDQTFSYTHTGDETVFIDSGLMKNILINLISNAIKYSPEDAVIEVQSETTPDQFSISVKDNGIGISEADQQKLFSRFFRGENAGIAQGTGLGLYIVKRYVEMMNGTITFKSELGKGSVFQVVFYK